MAEPMLTEFGRVDDRALRGLSAQVRWTPSSSLPVMLQVALFLLACGLCRHMWPINATIVWILIDPHQHHRPRSWVLRGSCGRWHLVVQMSTPNDSIQYSS